MRGQERKACVCARRRVHAHMSVRGAAEPRGAGAVAEGWPRHACRVGVGSPVHTLPVQ